MFKKIFITIFVLVVLVALILSWEYFDFLTFKPESETIEVGENTEKILNPQLEKTIEDYLVTLPELAWQTEEGTSNICVFENLDSENELFPLSLWVYCAEYRIAENGEIEKLSGSSLPLLLDYPNELSFYDIEKFVIKIPRNGSLYSEDIKEIFPANLQRKILFHNSIADLHTEMDKKIIEIKISL